MVCECPASLVSVLHCQKSYRAVQGRPGPSGCRHGRPGFVSGRPETLRAVKNRGEVGRDVARSAETWRGRQRRGEVGTDVARSAQSADVLWRAVASFGEPWCRRGCLDVVRSA